MANTFHPSSFRVQGPAYSQQESKEVQASFRNSTQDPERQNGPGIWALRVPQAEASPAVWEYCWSPKVADNKDSFQVNGKGSLEFMG